MTGTPTANLLRRLLAAVDVRDVVMLVGLVLIAVGVGLASVPAALVVVGSILFSLAVWPAIAGRRGGG